MPPWSGAGRVGLSERSRAGTPPAWERRSRAVFLIMEVLLGAALVLLQHVGRNPR